ncbi:hypothetical protein [Marinobacterium rhizophilum]|uniref:hypothetical protein n=1 Tax=Marinobacterium rhizophilum TaxID=420402 RepID=UPI00037123EA|nr:hypothetical protein [Marinobacterium rhizophilum]
MSITPNPAIPAPTDCATDSVDGYVDVKDEPRHVPRFENDYARVYDVRFKPGEHSLYHRHSVDTLYVAVYDTRVFDQTYGADHGVTHELPAGLCGCRPHGREPLIHRVRNEGAGLMQMIGAEHKRSPPVVAERPLEAPLHTPVADPFKGESIRCYQIDLQPGESTGLVEYPFSGLLVSFSDATLAVGDGRATQVVAFGPGTFIWHDGPIARQLHNVGKTPFRAVLGEWR